MGQDTSGNTRGIDTVAIITGSREFTDYEYFCNCVSSVAGTSDMIVSGGARGTDELAERYSLEYLRKPAKIIRADFATWGNLAGPMRNQQVIGWAIRNSHEQICIAFLSQKYKCKGTRDTIKKCREFGIKVKIFWFD